MSAETPDDESAELPDDESAHGEDPIAEKTILEVFQYYCEEGAVDPKAETVKRVLHDGLFLCGTSEEEARKRVDEAIERDKAEKLRSIKARKAEEAKKRRQERDRRIPQSGKTILTSDPEDFDKTRKK